MSKHTYLLKDGSAVVFLPAFETVEEMLQYCIANESDMVLDTVAHQQHIPLNVSKQQYPLCPKCSTKMYYYNKVFTCLYCSNTRPK